MFQMFFMGTSWVAVSINYIKTRASREISFFSFYFNSMNVAKHWYRAGEVFAISDCLVYVELISQYNPRDIIIDPNIYCTVHSKK